MFSPIYILVSYDISTFIIAVVYSLIKLLIGIMLSVITMSVRYNMIIELRMFNKMAMRYDRFIKDL